MHTHMPIMLPYHITHLNLQRQLQMPLLDTARKGNYLVFWWGDLALGDLYLAPGQGLTEQSYYEKLTAAIQPAVERYALKAGQAAGAWSNWLRRRDFSCLREWMGSVLQDFTPNAVPETVPVTVVICTRNRAQHLQQCLLMLGQLRCRPQQIVVVDNAPSDESTAEVVRNFEEVEYVKEPRAGLDVARNTGIRQASCPVVAFTDDDVRVHPLWVYRVWESFQDPKVAAMTGLVIASQLETEAQQIFEKHWSFNRGYVDKTYDEAYFRQTLPTGPPVWEIGAGANMAFRTSVFKEVGYFDERLDVGAAGCNGDSEMWYRVLAGGHSIHYNPRAAAFHEHRREIAALKKQIYYYMRGFTAAALVQQQQHRQAGYHKHLFRVLPRYYLSLIRQGFPKYPFQYRTLFTEIGGILSGLVYYVKNRRASAKALSR